MRRTIQSFNIPLGQLNFWRSVCSNSRPRGQELCSNAPSNFFCKTQNQRLWLFTPWPSFKSDLEDLFFWAIRSRKWNIYLKHLHTKRYHTCNPLERLETSGLTSPPLPGKVQTPNLPGQGRRSNARCPGGCWSLDLIGALQAHEKSWRIAYNLT